MRSTHACTPSFALFFSIFTSVVVYSRTNQLTPNTTKQVGVNCLSTWLCLVIYNISHDLHSCAIKKKNAEHTRMYTILSQLSFAIFTSVVVYSRTPINEKKQKKTKLWLSHWQSYDSFFSFVSSILPNELNKKRSKKKCRAHTHAHHLSQLSFSIFTSVVVYSRTKKHNPLPH